ncbi:MAG: hypothetical protein ACTHLK_22035 [Brucella intermedia]
MTNRIFMGQLGSRMLFRISPPGYSATSLADPAIVSSDNDYLKVHQRGAPAGDVMINNGSGGAGGRYDYMLKVDFPDLGYIPLVFFTVCIDSEGGLNNRVIFPNDTSGATDRYPVDVKCAVSTNGIWWRCTGYTFSQTLKIKYIVFKNRLL